MSNRHYAGVGIWRFVVLHAFDRFCWRSYRLGRCLPCLGNGGRHGLWGVEAEERGLMMELPRIRGDELRIEALGSVEG